MKTYNAALQAQLDAYLSEQSGLPQSKAAAMIGVSPTALSQYRNSKYPGDVEAVESKIEEFLRTRSAAAQAEAEKAREASRALFSGAGDVEHMPTTELTNDDLGGGQIDVLSLLVKCGLAASKGEARRLVQQGGVTVNDQKINSIDAAFGCEQFTGDACDPQG